jgi:hypothetical protein
MQKLEEIAVELGADKIALRAAIYADSFYEKLGYSHRDGIKKKDSKGNFVMEEVFQTN